MSRDWNSLPAFSQALYKETYFLPEENYDEWLYRVATAYQNDTDHGLRMMNYIQSLWFHPSTPISSNAGTDRGLPISCFTKSVADNKPSIFQNYNEAFNLGAYGGGIGTDWSAVRSVNEPVGPHGGKSSGLIPFLGVSDRSTLAISQGGLRRASEATYLDISHPEIEEFIDIRKETGDSSRRTPNLHHGVVISDDFMHCVLNDYNWNLLSPKTGAVVRTVPARKLWSQILEARITTGEPYLLFIDTVNDLAPEEYKNENIKVTTSNLCTEITLRTDDNHSGVCCLGSINLEYWDEYQHCFDQFIADCSDYLDNVLQDFINRTEHLSGFERARAGAIDERSIGLGVMGFHSLLQSKLIPWESSIAKGLNMKIFSMIKESADRHNEGLNACPMSYRMPDITTLKRNIHVTAIAPTMSISSLCGVTSSGIEPWVTNAFTKKVKQGSFAIKNKYLEKVINDAVPYTEWGGVSHATWISDQWDSIKKNSGSVQHLDWMSQDIKDVFKTAFELDQRWLLEFAGDRSPLVDQGQSLNIFIPAGSSVQFISDLHILAWRKKIKSLYYVRSTAGVSASTASGERKQIQIEPEECLACQ
jgi:ribonucleoside-diphosphate reductase alpha chain